MVQYDLILWLTSSFSDHYNSMPTEAADRAFVAVPWKISREIARTNAVRLTKEHPERFDALEKVGFKVNREGDPISTIAVRHGGHYVDIGASDLIIDGSIKVKSGGTIASYTKDGLMFEDGTELKADVIVLATGYRFAASEGLASIVGPKVAKEIDITRGFDEEGELRGLYKPCGRKSSSTAAVSVLARLC